MLTLEVLKLQEVPLNELTFYLDYDGCLCPHLEVWQDRVYDPQTILDLLKKLSSRAAGVFWNTGRRVASLESVHTDFLEYSGFFMQGASYWDHEARDLKLLGLELPDEWAPMYESLLKEWPELRLEVKSCSLRVAAFQGSGRSSLESFIEKEKQRQLSGWTWHLGSRGAELLADGFNKGTALRSAVQSTSSIPVALGDDLLDKPALEEAIRLGGYGIVVGEHCGWATEIDHKASQLTFCENVDSALEFLGELARPR